MPLNLNGFSVALSADTFTAYVRDVPDPHDMESLGAEFGDRWFIYWREGKAYGLPLSEGRLDFGVELNCSIFDNVALGLLARRIVSLLPSVFPKYEALRTRPFAFLGQRDELVRESVDVAGLRNVHPLVGFFSIKPKFELDCRVVELCEGQLEIVLVMDVGMRWDATAPIDELVRAGVDVAGLHVIRRQTVPGQRRLVGRIGRVDGPSVVLDESYDACQRVPVRDVWLEGSSSTFYRCLGHLLGSSFSRYDDARFRRESEFLAGKALDGLYTRMATVLGGKVLQLAPGLSCTFGNVIALKNEGDYRTVVRLQNPEYCFDPAKSKRSSLAWQGLERYGPYSRDSIAKKSPRILVLCPDRAQGQVEQFIKAFRDGIVSVVGSRYSAGFAATFGLTNPQFIVAPVPLLQNRGEKVATLYRRTAEQQIGGSGPGYDAALAIVHDEHSDFADGVNPYLHTKAVCLMAGIPVQEARLSTISRPHEQLVYVAQNMSIALYAKLGGVPWTVDHDLTVNDEIVIGMGSCELSGGRFDDRQRFIGITTVFRGDGNYLLSNVSQECRYADYPEVLRSSTLDVLGKIKHQNGWRPGDTVRVVFHAFKPLRNAEIADIAADCIQSLGAEQRFEFAFLTVSHAHPFRLLDRTQQGQGGRNGARKGMYVPERGHVVQLGRFTRLLCVSGPSLIKRATSPLPAPILIHLHPQSTYRDLDYLADQVLKFTSLSWRSTLPCQQPVTIYYSELIAGLLARLRSVNDWSPSMLNVKLRPSRWFL